MSDIRKALELVMNYPDVRSYLGSDISKVADAALAQPQAAQPAPYTVIGYLSDRYSRTIQDAPTGFPVFAPAQPLATPPTEPATVSLQVTSAESAMQQQINELLLERTITDGYRRASRAALQGMICSATQLVDGETVVGYQIKTGMLHKLVAMNQGGEDPVFFPTNLPSLPAPQAEPQAAQPTVAERLRVLGNEKFAQSQAQDYEARRELEAAADALWAAANEFEGNPTPPTEPAPQAEPAAVGELPPVVAALQELIALDDAGVLTLVADQAASYNTDFVLALSNARAALASAPHALEPLTEAIAAERERCAKLCEAMGPVLCETYGDGAECIATADACAEAIRAASARA